EWRRAPARPSRDRRYLAPARDRARSRTSAPDPLPHRASGGLESSPPRRRLALARSVQLALKRLHDRISFDVVAPTTRVVERAHATGDELCLIAPAQDGRADGSLHEFRDGFAIGEQ